MFPCFLLFLAALAPSAALLGQERPLQPGVDVLNYDFSLTLPDDGKNIMGLAGITIRRSQPLTRLVLDLTDLAVDSVRVNGSPVQFERKPGLIDILLPTLHVSSPDTIVVSVSYHGDVKDGLIVHVDPKGRWYAFGDNWPTRARCWLPCVDQPADKATVSWNISLPSDRSVVANGILIEEKSLPDPAAGLKRKLSRWRTSRPIPTYLMVLGAGPLLRYDLGLTATGLSEFSPGVPQSVYVAPELTDYPPGPFAKAGAIVEFFARTVAPFPYEKLAHVQSYTRYGGMENASAIFYANNLFEHRNQDAGIIAHETAHQWFGDAVTPSGWGHLWLSEGFASYFEQLWVEKSEGTDAFRRGMTQLRNEIIKSTVTYNHPVVDTLETNYMRLLNTNSYQKGAWTLHMLRSMLGDSLFFSGIRSYYDHHRHSTATTDNLCDAFERVAHRPLRWFFDEWLRRPGVAELTIDWSYAESTRRVTVEIHQDPRSIYRFPLSVEIHTTEGTHREVSVEVPAAETARVQLPIDLASKPARLVFDPHVQLLATIKSN
jgi:aminopeptidase N